MVYVMDCLQIEGLLHQKIEPKFMYAAVQKNRCTGGNNISLEKTETVSDVIL
jgi:hypothetical protein